MADNKNIAFKPGDILFGEGDAGDFFYIVKEGVVGIYKNYEGDKTLLALIERAQSVGELAAIDGKPRSASAVAVTPVQVMKIQKESFDKQLAQCPSWFRAITLTLVDRIRTTDELLGRAGIEDDQLVARLEQLRG